MYVNIEYEPAESSNKRLFCCSSLHHAQWIRPFSTHFSILFDPFSNKFLMVKTDEKWPVMMHNAPLCIQKTAAHIKIFGWRGQMWKIAPRFWSYYCLTEEMMMIIWGEKTYRKWPTQHHISSCKEMHLAHELLKLARSLMFGYWGCLSSTAESNVYVGVYK